MLQVWERPENRKGKRSEQLYQHCNEPHIQMFCSKKSDKSPLPTPGIILPSKGSSTSSSICLSVPSFMSFSVKISDGTSSLTVSPSSSDFASHLSHGNVTVSEPWSKQTSQRKSLQNTPASPLWKHSDMQAGIFNSCTCACRGRPRIVHRNVFPPKTGHVRALRRSTEYAAENRIPSGCVRVAVWSSRSPPFPVLKLVNS